MKCLKCGYENKDGNFCIKCGEKLKEKNLKTSKKLIKLVSCITLILLILIILFFIIKNIFFTSKINSIYNPNNPIVVEKDGLYGYMDTKGKTLLQPVYKEASAFIGSHTLVAIRSKDTLTGLTYQVIDKKGKVKYESNFLSDINYISDYDVWVIENSLYNGEMKKITSEDMYVKYSGYGYLMYETKSESGIIDYTGKTIFKWDYPNISMDISKTDEGNHYAEITNLNEKSMIISLQTGKILYENEDTSKYNIMSHDNNIFEVYNKTTYEKIDYIWFKDDKVAFKLNSYAYNVELKSKNILEIDYGYNYKDYGKSQRKYYYDYKNNNLLENYVPEKDLEFAIGEYMEYSCSNKKGLMKDDKVIIPCEYDDIKYFNNSVYEYLITKNKDLVILNKDNDIYLYDINKKQNIYKFETTNINDIDVYNSTFITYTNDNDEKIVYNILSNKKMNFDEYSKINIYSNNITVEENNKMSYYNTNLEKIFEI